MGRYRPRKEVIEILEDTNVSRITVMTAEEEEYDENTSNEAESEADQVVYVLESANESLRNQRRCLLSFVILLFIIVIILASILAQTKQELKMRANGNTGAAATSSNYGCAGAMGGGTIPPNSFPNRYMNASYGSGDDSIGASMAYSCGCKDCTNAVWNTLAGTPAYSCGSRITYLTSSDPVLYPSEVEACREVAFEFPCECGGCDPSRCGIEEKVFEVPAGWLPPPTAQVESAVTYVLGNESNQYCFPPVGQRVTYTMWNGKTLQVKEDPNGGLCGPGNNEFAASGVQVNGDDLTLMFTDAKAAEVRVLLPESQMPYTYGTYDFYVKSVAVKDLNGNVKSNTLPKEITLGMFTWNSVEDYSVHQNWNHEVDIEIGRWDCEQNADAQFLVQPPGTPQTFRYFTGKNATYDQGGHHYMFDWNPGKIVWNTSAGGGQTFTLTTAELLYKGQPNLVQCMPSPAVEVRINLWNTLGARQPDGYNYTDVVEVVIGNFTFTPSTQLAMADGSICAMDCQCGNSSLCSNGKCVSVS